MSNSYPLFQADELPEGEIKCAILPDGERIAVYNVDGTFYATADTCTHEEASLSEDGMVEGDEVICGWHFCAFKIASGEVAASPCDEPLKTYSVRQIDGVLHVER